MLAFGFVVKYGLKQHIAPLTLLLLKIETHPQGWTKQKLTDNQARQQGSKEAHDSQGAGIMVACRVFGKITANCIA